MNLIELSDDCAIKLDSGHYSRAQLENLVNAAYILGCAYARADEANGGGGSVRWEDLNRANELLREGFGEEGVKDMDDDAQAFNVFEPEAAAPAPPYEFKRAEDTEGGTCD